MNDELKIPLIEVDELEVAIKTAAALAKELQDMHDDSIEDEECEHEFDPEEGFMCLHCGAEGMETVMCAAHEAAENER